MMTHSPLSFVRAAVAALVASAAAPIASAETTPLAHIEVRGSGPIDLVLIPGLACDWTVWDSFMERNGDRYTMHAVTLPGFGGSEPPPMPESNAGTPWMDNAVEAIAEYMADHGLVGANIAGHSLGGVLAYRLAAEKPDVVGKAVSIDGLPAIPLGPANISAAQRNRMVQDMIAPRMLAMSPEQWAEQQTLMMQSAVGDQDRAASLAEMSSRTPASVGSRYFVELLKTDVRDELPWLDSPLLAIAAIPDDLPPQPPATMRKNWEDLIGGVQGVQLVFAEGSRHFVMDDDPELVDRTIAAFLGAEAGAETDEADDDTPDAERKAAEPDAD